MDEMRKLLERLEAINEAPSDVDKVLGDLQRELTSLSYKSQQISSFIKKLHPGETEKYNLVVDIEMELDALRKRVFDAR
jgi:uncharacterized protein (UPF0335 family)